ncbi:DUF1796 family putative cysteine peptidase [Sediminicoccus sp. KRV36]|uniref:DUF1796 family putative cysteine peptidase n=1 Tax=Sediminicoccus sp. KRV36 TaxID=3133721 RepID=UPI00200CDFC4|nr:DUF1796 family putative cysteine peptidase [Sediminicoccus rosea]UPY38056.1 papain-like cysteine peptidase [Sediminicoccus rosea]
MPIPAQLPARDVLETVIRATHQAFLGRSVDPNWQTAFTEELTRRGATQSLDEVVSDFMQLVYTSTEAKTRLLATMGGRGIEDVIAPGLAARPSPLACIGLGCMPGTAGMLRRGGLRRWAGPFDWMTIPAEAVRDSIVDDCAGLLLATDYEPILPEDRPVGSDGHLCRHVRLSELYGPTIFHRYDPSEATGYASLERATLRFREALRGLHGKLLLQVTQETERSLPTFEDTADMLDRSARGAILVTVALVEGPPAGPFPEMELAQTRGVHRYLRARTISEVKGTAFVDPLDEIVLLRGALAAPQISSM